MICASSPSLIAPHRFASSSRGVERIASNVGGINDRGTAPANSAWSYCNCETKGQPWVHLSLASVRRTCGSASRLVPRTTTSRVACSVKLSSTLVPGTSKTCALYTSTTSASSTRGTSRILARKLTTKPPTFTRVFAPSGNQKVYGIAGLHKRKQGLDIVNVIVRIKHQHRRLVAGPGQSVDPSFSLLSLDLLQSAPRHLPLALPPRASQRTCSIVDQDAFVDLFDEAVPLLQEVLFAQRSARQEFLVRTVEGRESREVEEERVCVCWVSADAV